MEVLGGPFTCFDASQYGALMIVDAEEEYGEAERKKLESDVRDKGLSLVIFAEWYNVEFMKKMRFFDDNTHSHWTPVTGGANVPALNELLEPFGMAFNDDVLVGSFELDGGRWQFSGGCSLTRVPAGSWIRGAGLQVRAGSNTQMRGQQPVAGGGSPVLALHQVPGGSQAGRIVAYGDSNCLDSSHQHGNCHSMLTMMLEFAGKPQARPPPSLGSPLSTPLDRTNGKKPERRTDIDFAEYSFVLQHPDWGCGPNCPLELQTMDGPGPSQGNPAADGDAGTDDARTEGDAMMPDETPGGVVEEEQAGGEKDPPTAASVDPVEGTDERPNAKAAAVVPELPSFLEPPAEVKPTVEQAPPTDDLEPAVEPAPVIADQGAGRAPDMVREEVERLVAGTVAYDTKDVPVIGADGEVPKAPDTASHEPGPQGADGRDSDSVVDAVPAAVLAAPKATPATNLPVIGGEIPSVDSNLALEGKSSVASMTGRDVGTFDLDVAPAQMVGVLGSAVVLIVLGLLLSRRRRAPASKRAMSRRAARAQKLMRV